MALLALLACGPGAVDVTGADAFGPVVSALWTEGGDVDVYVIDEHGADAFRWYLYTATPPGQERRFSSELVGEVIRSFTLTLWNVYSFFVTYANLDKPTVTTLPIATSDLDRALCKASCSRSCDVGDVHVVRDGVEDARPSRRLTIAPALEHDLRARAGRLFGGGLRCGRLGAVMVELPLRDAGCLLPSWDELGALSEAARERGVPFHADGARIWESVGHWGRTLAEAADLVDSMYGASGGSAR